MRQRAEAHGGRFRSAHNFVAPILASQAICCSRAGTSSSRKLQSNFFVRYSLGAAFGPLLAGERVRFERRRSVSPSKSKGGKLVPTAAIFSWALNLSAAFELPFLISISIMNRAELLALQSRQSGIWEINYGNEQERRIEARICSHGSRKTARNRKQGRKSEPRRRSEEQLWPPIVKRLSDGAG
jgi:hypothetical protein